MQVCLLSLYYLVLVFFVNDTDTVEIYTYCHTLALRVALPCFSGLHHLAGLLHILATFEKNLSADAAGSVTTAIQILSHFANFYPKSEEHPSKLQSLMRISYAVFCLKKKNPPSIFLHHHSTLRLTLYYLRHILHTSFHHF